MQRQNLHSFQRTDDSEHGEKLHPKIYTKDFYPMKFYLLHVYAHYTSTSTFTVSHRHRYSFLLLLPLFFHYQRILLSQKSCLAFYFINNKNVFNWTRVSEFSMCEYIKCVFVTSNLWMRFCLCHFRAWIIRFLLQLLKASTLIVQCNAAAKSR